MAKQSPSCFHDRYSIKELLDQLLLKLSFPGQTVVEFFPIFSCGKQLDAVSMCMASDYGGHKYFLSHVTWK